VLKPTAVFIMIVTIGVTYGVQHEREQSREADARRYAQTREDEQKRTSDLRECAEKAENRYFQESLEAASIDRCPYVDESKCLPISRAETLEWQKRALDEALAHKKMAVDVCIAAARK
jgi:hypothetical protein